MAINKWFDNYYNKRLAKQGEFTNASEVYVSPEDAMMAGKMDALANYMESMPGVKYDAARGWVNSDTGAAWNGKGWDMPTLPMTTVLSETPIKNTPLMNFSVNTAATTVTPELVANVIERPLVLKKSNEEIARDVIRGEYKNGAARKLALTDAGYDYATILGLVNKLIRGNSNSNLALTAAALNAATPTQNTVSTNPQVQSINTVQFGVPTAEYFLDLSDYTFTPEEKAQEQREYAAEMAAKESRKDLKDYIQSLSSIFAPGANAERTYNLRKAAELALFPLYMLNVNFVGKKQQGGTVSQDPYEQITKIVTAAMLGDKKALQQILQVKTAAEQGDLQATQLWEMIQQVIQQLQGLAQSAKKGAKLNYVRSIKGLCPVGEELVYMEKGGKVCPVCQKKKQEMDKQTSTTKYFTKQNKCGGKMSADKCGGKMKKKK